jgi:hypothetical protein
VSPAHALHKLQWNDIDVAVIEAADEQRPDDQFPGVAVVEHIRRIRNPQQTAIVIITQHYFNDALRRRLREAAADSVHPRQRLANACTLRSVVLPTPATPRGVPPVRDLEALFCHGVTESTRVNRAVAFALQHDLQTQLAHRTQPRSRYWLRLRREFNHHARLNPVTTDGLPPDRDQNLPSLPQIARFLTWATRVTTEHPPAIDRQSLDNWAPAPKRSSHTTTRQDPTRAHATARR